MISESGGTVDEHQFEKKNIVTAIHNDIVSSGAMLHLNENGEAVFNRDIDSREYNTYADVKDWRTDDWEPWAAYIEANESTYYQPERNSVLITAAKDSALPSAATNNPIDVVNNETMDPNPTVTEISDDLNGSTDWDCVFNINSSANITRTMPIPVAQQSDSLTFVNYSTFEVFSSDPAWIIGTKTYFFAVFRYRNVTRSTYVFRPCIIEFTTLDPADGNIRYFDYLTGATEADRAWEGAINSYPSGYNSSLYIKYIRHDISFGVYHDVSTNIMYVIGAPTSGNGDPISLNGFIHHATLSIDLDDATVLTTSCNEDMSIGRFMINGEIYTFTPSESLNYTGYTSGGYFKNYSEYVGCGPQQMFKDIATGKEYLFWACRWYETGNNLRYHYGILEVDRSGKTGISKDHVQATGTSGIGAVHCCRIQDSAYNTEKPETLNNAGHISVVKMDGFLIFFTSVGSTSVDFKRNLSGVISYDVAGDKLYTRVSDSNYGAEIGTTGSVTASDEAATIADDVVTYKFAHDAVTYSFDVTIDGLELWGDAAIRPEIHVTYTDIYFDSSTLMYYTDYAGERIAPAALCAYNAGADSSYHRQLGFIKYTVGSATSVTWHPCSPWLAHSLTSFSQITETNWSVLTPNIWLLPDLPETYYGGQFNQSGSNSFGRCGTYVEGVFDYNPRDPSASDDKLQIHVTESAVKVLYDFSIDEYYTSFPVTPMLRTVLVNESPLSPIVDDWGKRLELSRIGHFAWVLHDDPYVSRDYYAWNVMFSGLHLHADNAAANGRERAFYAHGLLPVCNDDTYTYLLANIRNRNPDANDSMDWQVWRINKTTYALERWPNDFFDSGHNSIHCAWPSGHTSYCNPDYNTWGTANYWGMDYVSSVLYPLFPFRPINSKYVIARGYTTATQTETPSWRYYWMVYDLETGISVNIVPDPVSSYFADPVIRWVRDDIRGNRIPDNTNGASIDGFRVWDYVEAFAGGQVTSVIGKSLGPTVNGITPVIITDNGIMMSSSEVEESDANYIVKPAGDILGERYYPLSINDRRGVLSSRDILVASKPHRSTYYVVNMTTNTIYTLTLNQAVFAKEKSTIIVVTSAQSLSTYPLIWEFNPVGDKVYLHHTYSSTLTMYIQICEWE